MTPRVKLVVLSRYRDIFHDFKTIVDTLEPEIPKLLVRSGDEIQPQETLGWSVVQGDEPFIFARNMNLGWRITGHSDVIIAGDDVRFETPFVEMLQRVAYSDPTIGFAVPELGGASAFVCAYIKRALINQVGDMDEQFDGYGYEDNDYYRRFEALGWRTQPTTEVKCRHAGGTSFYRRMKEGAEGIGPASERSKAKFEAKWGKQ
jgi:hypothetical protein